MLTPIILTAAMALFGSNSFGPAPAAPGPASSTDPANSTAPTPTDPANEGDTTYLASAAKDLDLAALAYSIELDLAEAGLARKQQNPKKALEAATRAWATATSTSPFDEQKDLLTRSVALRVQLLTELGLTEQALALAVGILIPEGETVDGTLTPATERLLTLRRQVALDPRVAERRREVEAMLGMARQMPQEQEIEDYVFKAFGPRSRAMDSDVLDGLLSSDATYLRSLGSRAAASLAAFVLYGPAEFLGDEEWVIDPLTMLTLVDDLGAARLILDHAEAGGTRFRLNALEAMRECRTLMDIRWYEDTNGQKQPDPTRWLDVLAAIVRDPKALPRCEGELRELTRRDGFHAALNDALIEAMHAGDAATADIVARTTSTEFLRSSTRPFLTHALGLVSDDVRSLVAESLSREVYVPELRALFNDPDPTIRRLVAFSMASTAVEHSRDRYVSREPKITADDRIRLRDLSDDPNPAVQNEALLAILALDPPFDAAFFDEFLERASDKDLVSLADLDHPDRGLVRRVLAAVARCPDEFARRAIDERLQRASIPRELDVIAVAFEIRRFETTPSIQMNSGLALRGFGHSAEGVQLLLEWGLKHNSPDTMVEGLVGAESWDHAGVVAGLPLLDLRRVFLETRGSGEFRVADLLRGHPEVRAALFLSIANDETQARLTRIFALRFAMMSPTEASEKELLRFLTDPMWVSAPPTSEERSHLGAIFNGSHADPKLLSSIAQDPSVTDPVCWGVFQSQYRDDEVVVPPIIAKPILSRFLGWDSKPRSSNRFLCAALASIPTFPPEEAPIDLLLQALKSTDWDHALLALRAMEQRPDTAYLDALGACVRGEGLRCIGSIEVLQVSAARALSGYRDPKVVPYLLAGLRISKNQSDGEEGSLTATIREALEIQELYQRKTEELASGKPQITVTREDSIARLIGQLNDKNDTIRRQAISALGTFGSLEALPYLIELLANEDQNIVHAAESAILDIRNQEMMKAMSGGK